MIGGSTCDIIAMPSYTCCISCNTQKRGKDDKFYSVDSVPNSLVCINHVRRTHISRKRQVQMAELTVLTRDSKLCKVCYKLCNNANDSGIDLHMEEEEDPEVADLSVYRKGGNSHSYCTFGCSLSPNCGLVSVSSVVRRKLLMEYKLLVKPDARMCSTHVGISNYWPLVKPLPRVVTAEDQSLILDLMFQYYHDLKNESKYRFDFENLELTNDDEFKCWFAFDKNQFKKICASSQECEAKHVAALLCKMRTGLSNEQIGYLFGVSRTTIARFTSSARDDLMKNLVPKFINYVDRSILLGHNTPMAKVLYDIPPDKLCFIFDATYRFAQKSANFAGQKLLWSEQKKAPLTKPMVGCTPDGYVAYVLGPYDAKHNDASILQDCFDRYPQILSTVQSGDFVLVDRGFRDVLSFLKDEKELNVFCPGLGQLDTKEANASRFVTKCRWVIEQKKKLKIKN